MLQIFTVVIMKIFLVELEMIWVHKATWFYCKWGWVEERISISILETVFDEKKRKNDVTFMYSWVMNNGDYFLVVFFENVCDMRK